MRTASLRLSFAFDHAMKRFVEIQADADASGQMSWQQRRTASRERGAFFIYKQRTESPMRPPIKTRLVLDVEVRWDPNASNLQSDLKGAYIARANAVSIGALVGNGSGCSAARDEEWYAITIAVANATHEAWEAFRERTRKEWDDEA